MNTSYFILVWGFYKFSSEKFGKRMVQMSSSQIVTTVPIGKCTVGTISFKSSFY